MDSARASGSDAFAFVQHMSRISEPSYSDSSSACADSGFGTGGHRSATRFTSRRRVGSHKTYPVEASRAVAKDSLQLTPMTAKARRAASSTARGDAVSYFPYCRAREKWRTKECEICRRPGPGFQLIPGKVRNAGAHTTVKLPLSEKAEMMIS
jgi:hypothetical protein